MFIATSARPRSRSEERNPAAEPSPGQAKAIALLRSFGVKKGPPGYKHLAPRGEATNNALLHFKLESTAATDN
jgi:hypothetical protein